MRDNAAWRREQERLEARGKVSAPLGPSELEQEVVALRAEVARLRAGQDCGAGPRLRATPCGNGQPTPCYACQIARLQFALDDLRR